MPTTSVIFQGLGPRQQQKAERAYNEVDSERWKSVERVATTTNERGYVDFVRHTVYLFNTTKPAVNQVAQRELDALRAAFPVVNADNLRAFLTAAGEALARAVQGRPFADLRQPAPVSP